MGQLDEFIQHGWSDDGIRRLREMSIPFRQTQRLNARQLKSLERDLEKLWDEYQTTRPILPVSARRVLELTYEFGRSDLIARKANSRETQQ